MEKVFVYFDLHRHCWSVKGLKSQRLLNVENGVKTLLQTVAVENATFKVSERGRQRVLLKRQRNVHAGVVGYITDPAEALQKCIRRVRYDPYRHPYFWFASNGKPVHTAPLVLLHHGRCFVE